MVTFVCEDLINLYIFTYIYIYTLIPGFLQKIMYNLLNGIHLAERALKMTPCRMTNDGKM